MDIKEMILVDHCYSRRDTRSCTFKPTKTLFPATKHPTHCSDLVDVITTEQHPPTEYDTEKVLQVMEECEKFVIFAKALRPEETPEDWEDNIPRAGWTWEQAKLFEKVLEILHADRLARLALKGSWSEAAKRRAHIDGSARRFRNVMAEISWDTRLTQWLHSVLVQYLDVGYLAAYVDILQSLKGRLPTLVDRLLAETVHGKPLVVQEGMDLLLKRKWDPAISVLNSKKLGKLPGNPIILLVPSSLKKPKSTPRCNLWSSHLSHLATLVTVSAPAGPVPMDMTPQAYLEQMITATKTRISCIKNEYPGRPIVMVGWRSGAAVALQIAWTEPLLAVVSLGLSTRTVEGMRGDPEDSIYNITCPVLFVTGEHATSARPEDLEEIRSQMTCSTGLVVVGCSDDCLRMARRHRINKGLTQSLVDRAVMEAVGDFLAELLLQSESPRPPSPVAPNFHVKRRLSTDSNVDSESSFNLPVIPKQPKLNPTQVKAVNGCSPERPRGRRGRKPGTPNKNSKQIKPIKTLQTLSPVKRQNTTDATDSPASSGNVSLDLDSIGSLGTTASVGHIASPLPVGPTATGSVTFRIHGGRVSAACAPPAEVMPPRLSSSPSVGQNTQNGEKDKSPTVAAILTPNRTLISTTSTSSALASIGTSTSVRPNLASTSSPRGSVPWIRNSLPPTIGNARVSLQNRTSLSPSVSSSGESKFTFTSPNRVQRNIIRMSAKRPSLVNNASSVSQIIRPPGRIFKSGVTTSVRAPSGSLNSNRFSSPKRLSLNNSSGIQQKSIFLKNRVLQADNNDEIEQIPFTIIKTRSDDEKVYGVRSMDSVDMPSILRLSSSAAEARATNISAEVGEPKKQSALVIKERKHLILSPEQYIVQKRWPTNDEVIIQERKGTTYYQDGEQFIYEVIES